MSTPQRQEAYRATRRELANADGRIEGWLTYDVAGRFAAYRWHVVPAIDGHDPAAITKAIDATTDRPSLLVCRTVIGWPAPTKGGTEKAHGAPLGREEVIQTRVLLGWPYPEFVVPEEIYAAWDAKGSGQQYEDQWTERLARYRRAYPELAAEFERRIHRELPAEWHAKAHAFVESACGEDGWIAAQWATRIRGRAGHGRGAGAHGRKDAACAWSPCPRWMPSRPTGTRRIETPCSRPPCGSAWPSRRGSEIIGTSSSGSTAR